MLEHTLWKLASWDPGKLLFSERVASATAENRTRHNCASVWLSFGPWVQAWGARVAAGVTDSKALPNCHAPLMFRRDMEMLGLIHRSMRGRVPHKFLTLFVQINLLLQTGEERNSACRRPLHFRSDRNSHCLHLLRNLERELETRIGNQLYIRSGNASCPPSVLPPRRVAKRFGRRAELGTKLYIRIGEANCTPDL